VPTAAASWAPGSHSRCGCVWDSLFSSFMSIMCPCEDDAMTSLGETAEFLRSTDGQVGSSRTGTSRRSPRASTVWCRA
jgi:hypothetical protein